MNTYDDGLDELVYDITASSDASIMLDVVEQVAKQVYIRFPSAGVFAQLKMPTNCFGREQKKSM